MSAAPTFKVNPWHAPQPIRDDSGVRARASRSTCITCGEPIKREGKFIASDGRRGTWVHVARKAVTS